MSHPFVKIETVAPNFPTDMPPQISGSWTRVPFTVWRAPFTVSGTAIEGVCGVGYPVDHVTLAWDPDGWPYRGTPIILNAQCSDCAGSSVGATVHWNRTVQAGELPTFEYSLMANAYDTKGFRGDDTRILVTVIGS
jgi:hypothetical protein